MVCIDRLNVMSNYCLTPTLHVFSYTNDIGAGHDSLLKNRIKVFRNIIFFHLEEKH